MDDFSKLVRQYQAMVFSIAWNFTRNEATAEEIAQEVFMGLHKTLHRLESEAHMASWLRRATMHRCIDYARHERPRDQVALEGLPEPSVEPRVADPLLGDTLRRLTASLPPTQRMIVILRYQEDLDPTDIAREMELPVSTVKSHLHRSLALLRAKLEQLEVRS